MIVVVDGEEDADDEGVVVAVDEEEEVEVEVDEGVSSEEVAPGESEEPSL